MIMHAGLLCLHHGSGKSDLALRATALGLVVASDDQTLVWVCENKLYGACPVPIAGLIEARGLGVLSLPATRSLARIRLIVDCRPSDEAIERMPDPERHSVLGIELFVLRLHALEPSAPIKLRWALSRLGAEP